MIKRLFIISATLLVAFFYAKYEKSKIDNYFEAGTEHQENTGSILKTLPLVSFTSEDGKKVKTKTLVKDVAERYSFFHFWATWCAPCEAEFPDLIKMMNKVKGNIKYYLVAVNDDKKKVELFLKKFRTHLDPKKVVILLDNNESFYKSFGTAKVPETYIFEKNSLKVHRKFTGPQNWLSDAHMKFLNSLK